MTAIWVVGRPTEREYYDTEREADQRAHWLITSRTATECVVYTIDVEEPPC